MHLAAWIGAQVFATETMGSLALKRKKLKIVRMLITAGADVNARDSQVRPQGIEVHCAYFFSLSPLHVFSQLKSYSHPRVCSV